MKFTCYEIHESFLDLDEVLVNEIDIMEQTKKASEMLIYLDTFQGETAEAIKNYLSNIHTSLILGIMAVCAQLDVKLRLFLEDYKLEVDGSTLSVIDTEHIGNLIQRMNTLESDFVYTKSQLSSKLSSVGDIFQTTVNYTTHENEIIANSQFARGRMQSTIDALESFDARHMNDCEEMTAVLNGMEQILNFSENMFVGTNINYDENNMELSNMLTNFYTSMSTLTESIDENDDLLVGCAEALSDLKLTYNFSEVLSAIGIAVGDYIELERKGIKLKVFRNSGNTMVQIVSDSLSKNEIKNVLNSMNLQHLTSTKFNKLTGKGLLVSTGLGNVKSASLVTELGYTKGFRAMLGAVEDEKFPTFTKKLGQTAKIIDGVGYGITVVADVCDNMYDATTDTWECDVDAVMDSATDIAVDLGSDVLLQGVFTGFGGLTLGSIGVAIGNLIGTVGSGFASYISSGEPKKTFVDRTKDVVSDGTHRLKKEIIHLLW